MPPVPPFTSILHPLQSTACPLYHTFHYTSITFAPSIFNSISDLELPPHTIFSTPLPRHLIPTWNLIITGGSTIVTRMLYLAHISFSKFLNSRTCLKLNLSSIFLICWSEKFLQSHIFFLSFQLFFQYSIERKYSNPLTRKVFKKHFLVRRREHIHAHDYRCTFWAIHKEKPE